VASLLVTTLVLLLLAPAAGYTGILLEVHNQPCPRLFLVPLEPCEVREIKLVISLRKR